jgi:hypothetical protein
MGRGKHAAYRRETRKIIKCWLENFLVRNHIKDQWAGKTLKEDKMDKTCSMQVRKIHSTC